MHTHSGYSEDVEKNEKTKISFLAREAKKNGIDILTVTDHCELDLLKDDPKRFDAAAYREEMLAEKVYFAKHPDEGAELLYGVELGQYSAFPMLGDKIISEGGFDFVLGSLHSMKGRDDFWIWDFSGLSDGEMISTYMEYLDELCELAAGFDFDSLAHITYPLRYYMKAKRGLPADINRYMSKIRELLDILISKDKALEINTSGLRGGYGVTLPPLSVASEYCKMGGKLITVGSDAHDYFDIGADIRKVYGELSQIGFEGVCVFRDRKAEMLNFDG